MASDDLHHTAFLKRLIPAEDLSQQNTSPESFEHLHLEMPNTNIFSITTAGGPYSKYRGQNQDSLFTGINVHGDVIAGVIDGCGGSKRGYLGGRWANKSLSEALLKGFSISDAFEMADDDVKKYALGGYASGVALKMNPQLRVEIGAKGDTKAMTIRQNTKLNEGTTRVHRPIVLDIEDGKLPAHAIHTARNKHMISSAIGSKERPLFYTRFQGNPGDQIILASDGIWDVISEYEILELSKKYSGLALENALYELAFERNNSQKPYELHFSRDEILVINPDVEYRSCHHGDNITVLISELTISP